MDRVELISRGKETKEWREGAIIYGMHIGPTAKIKRYWYGYEIKEIFCCIIFFSATLPRRKSVVSFDINYNTYIIERNNNLFFDLDYKVRVCHLYLIFINL